MTWTLGNLAENESRILTYRVKLKDGVPLNTGEIKNQAQVYAKTYLRATDDASFTPKIKYNMPKSKILYEMQMGRTQLHTRLNFSWTKMIVRTH